ncbi:MAG: division/cell wall cluster transcriptional repressor MraZ [Candidatus Pacebacteria bacterium]|nr:division/cell wall cluster transcriptional repressor MraZ [Candidatus Paceibacterota bacterium]MDD2796609.1 division/cell wall cluster transcriptional repressor MraZ [Candidatus Paceibacterota bacterium]MDD3047892.1 division/cell wall cluster transcriptional repressor MraZ [Candidatus Paceibacterota bacterium]MDD3509950.1 division/cell wall cluster transcriptional repressor MraZ [Candidatus Paceibacterota bacterium]MDD3918533.1 division/cell wall cluster transcriptional repressor MraZ [Candi
MLIGEYKYNLDDKKRLTMPSKFRTILGKKAIVTKGIDGCLFMYSEKAWKELAEKIAKLPFSQSNARSFSRIMLAGAMDVLIDTNGRILIPDYLKEYAGLDKKVVVAGLYSRIEVWDEDKWDKYNKENTDRIDDVAEGLKEFEI